MKSTPETHPGDGHSRGANGQPARRARRMHLAPAVWRPSHDPGCPSRSHKRTQFSEKDTLTPTSGHSGGINSNRLENVQFHSCDLRSNKTQRDTRAGRRPRSAVFPVAYHESCATTCIFCRKQDGSCLSRSATPALPRATSPSSPALPDANTDHFREAERNR